MKNFIEIISKPDNVAIVIMIIMVLFFTILAFYYAISGDRRRSRKIDQPTSPEQKADGEDKIHSWPYLVRIEFLVAIIVIVLLNIWSVVLDAPLEEFASETRTPNPAKAPWYFLGLQEMLVYFDPWIAGVVLPTLIIVGLCIIPYIDINPKGNGYYTWRERKFAISIYSFGFLALWIALIVIGVFMRGPGWVWFWPWQEWDPHIVTSEINVDLSQIFGIDARSFAGSVIGGLVTLGYFAVGIIIPYIYSQKRGGKFLKELGPIRYLIVAGLLLIMIGLPIKIFLRLIFHIKYIWVTPWFNI
ncbi:MAG: hypothetical protein QF876_03255 [Desulfobacterales bacterium]|jgi:hypothetical protein|nr:hypothetical protein [Desulfobacterales bacterium]MDP6808229.1 hypothetical protein [Desulfobacterales bacterium]|tara:strand:- start:14871 stop:15773 length:903 start_codon:yes stop_codon:yes gene_type:complete